MVQDVHDGRMVAPCSSAEGQLVRPGRVLTCAHQCGNWRSYYFAFVLMTIAWTWTKPTWGLHAPVEAQLLRSLFVPGNWPTSTLVLQMKISLTSTDFQMRIGQKLFLNNRNSPHGFYISFSRSFKRDDHVKTRRRMWGEKDESGFNFSINDSGRSICYSNHPILFQNNLFAATIVGNHFLARRGMWGRKDESGSSHHLGQYIILSVTCSNLFSDCRWPFLWQEEGCYSLEDHKELQPPLNLFSAIGCN